MKAVLLALVVIPSLAFGAECKVAHWNWSQSYGILKIEGVVEPPSRKKIYVQMYDGKGEFIGADDAYVKPGGMFRIMTEANVSGDKLRIKYTCE